MTKITLTEFINKTKGTKVDVPWQSDGHLKGQCVSLIQQYISQCLEQPAKARGDAKDWITSYPKEGLGKVVNTPQKGDILVFPKAGVVNGVAYGHIGIYISANKMYDQNNGSHDNRCAGYGEILKQEYVILRPNATLLKETTTSSTSTSATKYVYNCDSLNVRNGAGTNYKAINELVSGTKVNVLEVKNGWARIDSNQWVSNNFLTTTKPSKVYETKEVITSLNVRTSNSFTGTKNLAKEKCPLPKGTLVSVITTSGSGVQIGKNRWVYKTYLK